MQENMKKIIHPITVSLFLMSGFMILSYDDILNLVLNNPSKKDLIFKTWYCFCAIATVFSYVFLRANKFTIPKQIFDNELP